VAWNPRANIGLIHGLPSDYNNCQNFCLICSNETVTPDSDPGSSLDSSVRENDWETPVTLTLQDSILQMTKGTLFFVTALVPNGT